MRCLNQNRVGGRYQITGERQAGIRPQGEVPMQAWGEACVRGRVEECMHATRARESWEAGRMHVCTPAWLLLLLLAHLIVSAVICSSATAAL